MEFETQIIPIDEQSKLADRLIDDYKSLLKTFDHDDLAELRDGIKHDLLTMIAIRRSLSRLESRGEQKTSIAVPANEAWLRRSKTMQILTRLDAEGLQPSAQRGKISDAKSI